MLRRHWLLTAVLFVVVGGLAVAASTDHFQSPPFLLDTNSSLVVTPRDASGNTLGGFVGSAGNASVIACDKSVVLNSTASAQLVAASGASAIYVCAYNFTLAGTTPTVQFEYGTGATCATGTSVLTGTMAPTSGSTLMHGSGLGTVFRTPASQALCVVLGGTSPSAQGVVSYAQF